MIRTTTMKLSSLCLSLSLLNYCVFNKTLLLLFMKFCIKSETTFERRREKKGKISDEDTYVRTKWCLSVQKILAKEYHKPTETLSSRIQKKQKPLHNARAKKWCVPSGGKSLLVL